MGKKILLLFLLFLFSFSVVASQAYDDHVTQLSDIVSSLIYQSQELQQSEDSVEISPFYDDIYDIVIFDRFNELMDLFIEARSIQNNIRGTLNESPIVISGFSEPCYINDVFLVGFAREEYLVFIDLIADFVGLSEDMIKPMVWGVFRGSFDGEEADFDLRSNSVWNIYRG